MAKRAATTELTDLNWNQEEEPEDRGVFKKATDEALKKRVIKTARRRNPIGSSETPPSSVFGNFSGFATKAAPPASAAFSFLNNLNQDKETPTANGTSAFVAAMSINSPLFKIDSKKEEKAENDVEYLAKVKSLNEGVSNWIKSKVEQNPYVNLQPIFKDYEKYFEDLKKGGGSVKNDAKADNSKPDFSTFSFKLPEQKDKVNASKPSFSFGSGSQVKSDEKTSEKGPPKTSLFSMVNKEEEKKPTFTFGLPSKDTAPPKFSFGVPASTATTSMFSFGTNVATTSSSSTFSMPTTTSTPFTFSNVAKPAAKEEESKNDEEDEEPPKNEFTPVVEEGHVYTSRCKVFVKNDGKFGDRGVGTLYLKPVPDSEKVQLIIRADTSLGNLLCNFILSKSIPIKRMGKRDVMLVTVPTPDSKPPPVPILLRVKTPEEADELFTELDKHKK